MKTIGTFMKVALAVISFISFTAVYAGPPTWQRVNYTNTTAFVGEVQINAYDSQFPETVKAGDYIGAFVNGECRMIAQVFAHGGKLYVSSVIHGGDLFDGLPADDPAVHNSQELVEFKVWSDANSQEIAKQVKGTLHIANGGEVLDYIIGKPNTDSELLSLEVAGVAFSPAFSASTTDYTVIVDAGSGLPAVSDYTALKQDSRATIDIAAATNTTDNNVTIITVTAEDGSTTVYTITFEEDLCPTAAPIVSSPLTYCQGETAGALTAQGEGLLWYTEATGGNGSATAPIISTDEVNSTTYYVSATTTCESPRAEIEVIVLAKPSAPNAASNSPVCQGETIELTAGVVQGASYSWSGPNGYTSTEQNPTIAGATATNAGNYSVEVTVDGCTSNKTEIAVVVNTLPSLPVVAQTEVSVIVGSPAPTLSAQVTDGGEVVWYNSDKTEIATGSSYTTTISTVSENSYIFYAANRKGNCESDMKKIIVTVSDCEVSAPIVSSPLTYCQGETAGALTAQGEGLLWYTEATGGNGSATAPIISTDEVNSTTYYVSATTTCESPRAEIEVIVLAKPSAPNAASNSPLCEGETIELTAGVVQGASYSWSGPNGYTSTEQNPTIAGATATNAGNYSVEVTVDGCTSNKTEIAVVVNALPTLPVVAQTEVSVIIDNPAPILSAQVTDGGEVVWYNSNKTEIATGSTYTTTISTATENVFVFYAANRKGNCESDMKKITVTVSDCEVSAPIVSSPLTYCQGETAGALTAQGVGLQWYTEATGGNGSATAPIISTDEISETTYYVSSSSANCESPRSAITVTVKASPDKPSITSNSPLCEGSSLELSAQSGEGVTYSWSGPSFSSTVQNPTKANMKASMSGIYSVTASINGCTSESAEIDVKVNEIPVAPTANNVVVQVGMPVPNLTAVGENLTWYTSEALTNGVKVQEFTTNKTEIGEYTFYVTQTANGCESPATAVTLKISCSIATPQLVEANKSICAGGEYTFKAITSGNDNIIWTDSQGTIVSTTDELKVTKAGDYFVKQQTQDGTCESVEVKATLHVIPLPAAPVTEQVSVCYNEVGTLTVGKYAHWYQTADASAPLFSGINFKPTVEEPNTYEYFVSEVANGCEGPKSLITYKINALPTLEVENVIVPLHAQVPDLAVITNSQNTVTWYDSDKTTVLGTGTSYATGKTEKGVYIYYVEATSPTACNSGKQAITLQISDCDLVAPAVSASQTSVCYGESAPQLQAIAINNVRWYSDAALTEEVSSASEFTPAVTDAGTYTYYAVQYSSCVSPSAAVSFTIHELPHVTITAPTEIVANAAPVTITVSPLGGILSGSGISGSTFDPSLVNAGETYTITYSYTDAKGCSNSTVHAIEVLTIAMVDRTPLGDTIARANSINTNYANDNNYTAEAKLELQNAITLAQYYYDNYQTYTNQELATQVENLSQAISNFLESSTAAVDKSALISKIQEAQDLYTNNSTNVGTNPGQYPLSSFTDLNSIISNAQSVVNNTLATQLQVTNAIILVEDAMQTFINSQIPGAVVDDIQINQSIVRLVVGQKYTPQVTFIPASSTGNIQWQSSNAVIASVIVGTGEITAKSKGTTTITGTLLEDQTKRVTIIVNVSGTPELVSTTLNNVGNQIILTFSEPMAQPTADIFTNLIVAGQSTYFYTVTDAQLSPTNNTQIILSLASIIDNPAEVTINYSGASLLSEAGASAVDFTTNLAVGIENVEQINIFVYPTLASSVVTVEGVQAANLITVVNAQGQIQFAKAIQNTSVELNVTQLAQGVYTIIISNAQGVITQATFIKK